MFIEDLRGTLRDNKLVLAGCLEMMKSQLFLFLRISIAERMCLRMMIILTFVIYFKVIIRAAYRV